MFIHPFFKGMFRRLDNKPDYDSPLARMQLANAADATKVYLQDTLDAEAYILLKRIAYTEPKLENFCIIKGQVINFLELIDGMETAKNQSEEASAER